MSRSHNRFKDKKVIGERADWDVTLLLHPWLNARVWQKPMRAFRENQLARHSIEYCIFQHYL